jgi:hypothetical protein
MTALGYREGVDRRGEMRKQALEGTPRVGVGVEEHDRDAGPLALLHVGELQPVGKLG